MAANPVPAKGATTDNEGMTLVLKFAWRHHVLQVEEFDSLDYAVSSARYMADEGDEAFDHIEVHVEGQQPRMIFGAELDTMLEPEREAEIERWREAPKPVAIVEIANSTDKVWTRQDAAQEWARHDTFLTVDKAMVEAARLRAVLGPDRVRVMPLKNGLYQFRSEPIG